MISYTDISKTTFVNGREVNKVREFVYDNIKGIGILLVVLGHVTISPVFLQKLIYAFHMPMFFILSGYLFNVEKKRQLEFKSFAISRFKRLYLPSLFIGFSCSIPSVVIGQTDSLLDFATRAFGVIYSIPAADLTFNCTPIWFLTCLLCVEILFFCLVKYIQNNIWIFVFCSFSIGVIISQELSFYSPLNSHIALSAVFFFYLGTLLRSRCFIENHTPNVSYISLAVVVLLLATYLNPVKIDLSANRLGDINLLILGTLSGSYLVYCLAKKLGDSFFIGLLGRNTIFILGYNYWAYQIIDHLFIFLDLPYNWIVNFIVQVLIFVPASLTLNKLPLLNRLVQGATPTVSRSKIS